MSPHMPDDLTRNDLHFVWTLEDEGAVAQAESHSNLRRTYVESTSNLRRTYVESTSNLRRIYIEPTSNLRRTYIEPTSNLRRTYVEPTSNLHREPLKEVEMTGKGEVGRDDIPSLGKIEKCPSPIRSRAFFID